MLVGVPQAECWERILYILFIYVKAKALPMLRRMYIAFRVCDAGAGASDGGSRVDLVCSCSSMDAGRSFDGSSSCGMGAYLRPIAWSSIDRSWATSE